MIYIHNILQRLRNLYTQTLANIEDGTIYQRSKNIIAIALIIVGTGLTLLLNTKFGFVPSLLLLFLFLGSLIILFCFLFERLAFYAAFAVPFILFTVDRFVVGQAIPIGIIQHLMVATITFIMLTKKLASGDRSFTFLRNPVTVAFSIYFVYLLLQAANPNLHGYTGWLIAIRFTLALFMTYVAALYLFKDLTFIRQFFNILVFFSALTAIYALKQKFFGYANFEMRWIYANPMTLKRIFIWGEFRIFSLLSDPAAFGLFMSATSVATFIASFSKKGWMRILFLIAAVLMLVAMSFSGTRTAYAMVIAGISIYTLMRITRIETLLFLGSFILAFCILMYGPFYGGVFHRIRSTFDSDDGSLNVRDVNRQHIQPYIYANPFGGGPLTTGPQGIAYSPNHILAGFPSDNGYLKIALEQGYIGLIVLIALFFTSLRIGVRNYYRAKNPEIRTYLLAMITFLFSMMLGLYAQPGVGQIPMATVFWSFMGFTARIMDHDG